MSSDLEVRIALLERSELQRQRDERKWRTEMEHRVSVLEADTLDLEHKLKRLTPR